MILTLSWISILLLLYIIYCLLTEKTKENALAITLSLFFIFLFFGYDYSLNTVWDTIDRTVPQIETCILDEYTQECSLNYDYSELTEELQNQLELRQSLLITQQNIISILSYLSIGAIGSYIILFIAQELKRMGVLH